MNEIIIIKLLKVVCIWNSRGDSFVKVIEMYYCIDSQGMKKYPTKLVLNINTQLLRKCPVPKLQCDRFLISALLLLKNNYAN